MAQFTLETVNGKFGNFRPDSGRPLPLPVPGFPPMVCPRRRPPSSDEHEAQRVRADSGVNQAISLEGGSRRRRRRSCSCAPRPVGRARARRRACVRPSGGGLGGGEGRAVRSRAPAQHAGCTWDARGRAPHRRRAAREARLSVAGRAGAGQRDASPASPGGKSYVPVVRVPCGPRARVGDAGRAAGEVHLRRTTDCGTVLLTYCARRAALDKA